MRYLSMIELLIRPRQNSKVQANFNRIKILANHSTRMRQIESGVQGGVSRIRRTLNASPTTIRGLTTKNSRPRIKDIHYTLDGQRAILHPINSYSYTSDGRQAILHPINDIPYISDDRHAILAPQTGRLMLCGLDGLLRESHITPILVSLDMIPKGKMPNKGQALVKQLAQDSTIFTFPIACISCYDVLLLDSFGELVGAGIEKRGHLPHTDFQKEVKIYVNDMIAKSKTLGQHINDLCKLFERPQKYQPRLNPTKCTFGVRTGKLLRFIVNKRGIELDLDKVKAIRNISALKTKTEVSGFLGRVNYIARFISQLMATCRMIFKLLRKNQKIEWNQECQEAFEKVKQYLESPPFLVPMIPSKPLILYLTVLKESIGGILGQQDDFGKEQVIYYLNKKFTECEQRYPALE
ncbi:Retrovirus-related Pol polyprotein, partial [Mucuna pruriens]